MQAIVFALSLAAFIAASEPTAISIDVANCLPIAAGVIGASVPVSCLHSSCYIRRARTTRLLEPERRQDEQTVSSGLCVP